MSVSAGGTAPLTSGTAPAEFTSASTNMLYESPVEGAVHVCRHPVVTAVVSSSNTGMVSSCVAGDICGFVATTVLGRSANVASDATPAVASYTEVSGRGTVAVSITRLNVMTTATCTTYVLGVRWSLSLKSRTDFGTRKSTTLRGSLSGP